MSHKDEKADNRVIAYVSEDELTKVDELAKAKRVSRSWIVREAVIQLLESDQIPSKQGAKA